MHYLVGTKKKIIFFNDLKKYNCILELEKVVKFEIQNEVYILLLK